MVPLWRTSIDRALHRNCSLPNARYVQLATVDRDRRPKNRTIVFRGWLEPDSQLKFVTDIRSQKAIDLRSGLSNWAEICWYFPQTREQFRLSGQLMLVTVNSDTDRYCKARQEAWQQLSDRGRIQFDWAMPGAQRSADPQAFNPPQPDARQPLDNFCLLLLMPSAVDHLDLRGEPQNRYYYELIADKWVRRSVNP